MRRLVLAVLAVVVAFALLACAVPSGSMMKRGAGPDQSSDAPPGASKPSTYEGGRK